MSSNGKVRSSHRMLSFVLSLIMMISLIPVSVFADEEIKDPTETEGIEETLVTPELESDMIQESEPNQDLEFEIPQKTLESNDTEYKFTTQPKSGSFDPTTMKYHVTWATSFKPEKIKIEWYSEYLEEWYDRETLTSDMATNLSYDIPLNWGEGTYRIRAYYYAGASVTSSSFQVDKNRFKFTTQPKSGSFDPTTMKYHVTWATSFKPEKIEIEWYSEYLNAWYNKVTLTSDMATNLSCDMPLNWGEGTYRIRAYYEKNSYVTSSSFYVDKNGFKFTTQPINGFFDPIDGMCLATWTTSFKPEKIVIEWYSDYLEEWYVIETLTSDMATNLSYAIHRSWGKGSYRIRAYYDSDAYVTSNTFTISEDMPATSGKCGKNGSELTWSYNSHTLTITGNGEMADYSVSTQPWKLLRSQIKKVVLEEGVKSVGAYAFVDHLALSEVHLPSSLTSIRVSGFYNNATLKDVYCNFSEASAGSLGIAGNNEDIKNASWHYAYRDGGKCGAKLNWRLESDNTLVISGSGPMYDREYASDVPWFKYRNDIVAVRMEGGTSVGKYAFGYLSKLESATIPSTVTAMHDYAFSTCSSLKTLTINSTAVNIPAYFCYNCTSLESITIPKGTVRIGSSAFYGCTSLTSVAFPSGSNLSYIENSAFEGCTNLGNISIPSSVISIGNYAFRNCQSFTTLALPSSLTSLGEQAFANCKNITGTIAIPSGVTSIPASCFYNCSSFNKVTFGPNVVHIWNGAFGNCTNLSSVYYDGFRSQWLATTVDSSNSKLTSASFSYLYIYKKLPNSNTTYTVFGYSGRLNISGSDSLTATSPMPWTEYGPYITELDISGSFTSIQAEAFKNFTAVKTLYLPETIKTVGARAFQDCTSLTDVYFGGVTSEWLRVSIGADNEPLEDAEVYCTGTIGGRIPDCDMYWDFNDVDTLTIYFDMDAGYTDMPDFRDDREQPWYEYQSRIKHLIISEGVTYLGDENFSCLNKLEDVVFPSSIERMGSGVFSYCHSLEDVILPDSVESITASTFWSCGNLNSVKLPSNLKTIPASMFYNSGTLNRVYIPSTVTSIEYNAFKNCTDLCDIYFDGTSAQWSKISIASGNDKLNSVNIHFVVPELAINEKNFPDANFRAYIKEKFDTDKSGWLTNTERLAVRSISCSGRSIGSLSGIENFPKLTSLICSNNSLRGELDLRQNLMLLEVYCDNNEELGKIYIDGLADLQILDCHGDLSISSPNLSTNYALRKLDVSNCQISGLNVKSNSALQNLICNDNQLTYLDLSNNLKLKSLVCYSNCLTKLDVTDHSDLTYIDCADNKLTYIKLGNLPNCTVLKCQYNNLISLDIVGCPHLVECVLSEDTNINDGASFIKYILGEDTLFVDKDVVILTEHDGVCLDETNFPDASFREYLSGVEFDKDQNGWLSIQELESVTEIDISFSDVSDLTGLQYFTYLKTLYACVLDNLTELDLSGNPELEYLDCWDTQIEELDLSANRRLTNLDCNNTPLNSLDVSGLTSLKNVDVSGCSLFELDVSDCKLTSLRCNDNPLTALVLGDQPNLQNLCCNGTDLTELDISRCPLLVDLFCNGTSSESGGVVTYANGSYGFQLKLDSAIEVIYEHDGVAITEANFPDDNFRAFVYENFDTDKNGWLSEDEISNVTDIQASSMNISSLKGIEYFTNLEILNINYNELESLDLSKNTALGILECNNNRIQVLDLRANKNLFALYAGGMETLVGLNVTGLTEMKTIAVHDDSLTKLDLSDCKIELLNCSCNPLSSLILGDQPTLNYLACFGTDFVTLDISRCPHLVNTWLNGEHTEYEWGLEVSLAEEGYMEIDSSVSVTLPAFVEITSQPESISGQIGEEKTMSVVAENATSYQWQRSTDGEEWKDITTTNVNYKGAQEDTLTVKISKTTTAYRYRCVVGNDYGSVPSEIATVTLIQIELQITSHPGSIFGQIGEEKTMSVVAPSATSYQWQRSTDGVNWTKISTTNTNYKDAKTDTLTIKINKTTAAYQYRCMVANDNTSVASNPASVTVMEIIIVEKPEITTQPADVTGAVGEEKTMSVVAENADSYQWQRSADGEAWSNISSTNVNYKDVKTATLTIKISKTTASYQYRCMVKNDTDSVPSEPASVTVAESAQLPEITTQPADVTGEAGEEKTMSVVAENATSYHWQRSADGEAWSNISSTNKNYTGAKTDTLTIKISKTTASYQYRCMVKNDTDSVPSEPASVTVAESAQLPVITTQPADVTGEAGEEKTMSVVAENATSYQWQRSADGEAWSNISSTNVNYKDAKTSTLTIKVSKTTASYQYRCVVKNDSGSVPSEAASVTIGNVFEITVQPESITGQYGEEKTMSVVAPDAVSYQWQRSADGEAWSNISSTNINYSGAKTDTLTVKISKTTSSYVYRCIVKNEAGEPQPSLAVEVTLQEAS